MERHARSLYRQPPPHPPGDGDDAGAAAPFGPTQQEVPSFLYTFVDVFFLFFSFSSEQRAAATSLTFLYKWERGTNLPLPLDQNNTKQNPKPYPVRIHVPFSPTIPQVGVSDCALQYKTRPLFTTTACSVVYVHGCAETEHGRGWL